MSQTPASAPKPSRKALKIALIVAGAVVVAAVLYYCLSTNSDDPLAPKC